VKIQFRELTLPFVLDLVLVVGVTVLLAASWLLGSPTGRMETVLTSILVIGYAFSVPGYALVAALFARHDEPWESIRNSGPRGGERIDGRSRVILSIALSPIVTGMLVVGVDLSPLSLDGGTVLSTLAAFVLTCVSIAFVRRKSLSAGARYRPVLGIPVVANGDASRAGMLFVGITVVSVFVAGGSLAYTTATWEPGERFTELAVLTPEETDGAVANDYDPEGPLLVKIGNQEHRQMNYTLVVRKQRVTVENGTATVVDDFDRSRIRVAGLSHGETRRVRIHQTAAPENTPFRLAVFLYRGSPPQNATAGSAYRRAYLWFNVPDGANASSAR